MITRRTPGTTSEAAPQSALLAATHAHLRTLAVPLLGGSEGYKFVGAMEAAVDFVEDTLEPTGMIPPEVIFVERGATTCA